MQRPHTTTSASSRLAKAGLFSALLAVFLPAAVQAERNYFAWAHQYDPAANFSQNGVAVAVDRRGNVAATGYTFSNGNEIYYTAKYDSLTGAKLWDATYASGFGHNRPSSVACDSQGNVIVTGRSVGNGTSFDYYTIKYASATGTVIWEKRYHNVGADEAIKVVVDFNDDVIVTGKSVDTAKNDDFYTIKYTKDFGNKVWDVRYSTVFSDRALALAVDPAGNVAVTGVSNVAGNECYYTAKYRVNDGFKLWSRTFDGAGNKDDAGRGVAMDAQGNVFVTGTERNSNSTHAFHTFKYQFDNGNTNWQRTYNAPVPDFYDPAGIAVDTEGNAYITGSARKDNFTIFIYTARYNAASGAIDWETTTPAPGQEDRAYGIAADGSGNAVIIAASKNEDLDFDFYAVKYSSPHGDVVWEQRLNGPNDSGQDYAYGLAVDGAGNVAVTGTAKKASPSPYDEMLTVKFNRFLLTSGDLITGPGLTTAAYVSVFNVPAIADNGALAVKGTVKDGKKIYAAIVAQPGGGGNTAFALQGQPAPGTGTGLFKSFNDPVTSPDGRRAFIAKLSGVPGTEATGVWTDAFTGSLERALQVGKQVPGLEAGVLLKSITNISLRNGYLTALITVKGANVNGTNSTVLLGMNGANSGYELLRTSRNLMVDTTMSTIKKISIFTPPKTEPGHGRYHGSSRTIATVTLADKRTAVVVVDNTANRFVLAGSNGDAGLVVTGAKWKSFGPPAVASNGFHYATLATLQAKVADVTTLTDTAIVYSFLGGAFDNIAVEGGTAPDTNGGTFTGFTDPISNDQGRYAFLATAKGGNIGVAKKTGLWFGPAAGVKLLARVGLAAPDAIGNATTATFSTITNIALPGGMNSGPIFLATLKGTGVNGKNNAGLFGVDSDGFVRQLLRNGDVLGPQTVKKFVLLNSLPGCMTSSRSFNGNGGVVALVSFTDKKQALVYVGVP